MKYFKVHLGYEQTVSITEDELSKAMAAQISGGVAVFKNGSVRGSAITLIEPDYHRAMGYNENYKLQAEDWSEIRRSCSDYAGIIDKKREEVKQMLTVGQLQLNNGELKQLK